MQLTLNDKNGEREAVRMALRGYCQVWTKRAAEHERGGYTAAAMMYMRDVWRVREVLRREFGDE